MRNTYQKGILTFYFYPTADNTFVVACEQLCLVKEGKDAEHTKLSLLAAAKEYIINVCRYDLGEHLLNQSLPEEIIKEFNAYRTKKKNERFEKWTESIDEVKNSKIIG